MTPNDPRHGANAGYIAGCRDRCCKDAHAAYKRGLWRTRYRRRAPALYIDATGSQRRIRALQAIGWTYRDINEAAGWSTRHPGGNAANVMKQAKVHLDSAQRISASYAALSMRLGDGPMANRQRNLARRKGWPPPLAWDDDRIDDPSYRPSDNPTRTTYRAADLAAEWDHLRTAGISIQAAAKQLGVSVAAIEKALERREDVA